MISLTCRISKMTQMNSSAQQEETHKENRLVGAKGKRDLGAMDWELGLGDANHSI